MPARATNHRIASVVFRRRTVTCTCGWSGQSTDPDQIGDVYAKHRKDVGVRAGQMSNILADGGALNLRSITSR